MLFGWVLRSASWDGTSRVGLFHVLFRLLICLSSFLLIGCAAQKLRIAPHEIEQKWLPFLEDGRTTKEDVLVKFGLPSAQFEGERILTYRLMIDENEGPIVVAREAHIFVPRSWYRAEYNLVLIFDDQHILQKHSLIQVRARWR